MKILITGAKGMLAQAVRRRFEKGPKGQDNEIVLTDRLIEVDDVGANGKNEIGGAKNKKYALDITDYQAVSKLVNEIKPDLIINCAAYTNVDAAEQAEELAEQVNAKGPENLAKAAVEVVTENGNKGAILVHISTDYVFGGAKPITEVYSEDDPKDPQSVYGKTKLAGERAIEQQMGKDGKYYIFRTAWLYGKGGKNFVQTMITVGRNQEDAVKNGEKEVAEVSVVDDQHGSPTYTEDLTDIIYQAVYKQIPFGVYNATNEGFMTWADFTREIYKAALIDCNVRGITSEEYEEQAKKKAADMGVKRIVAQRPKNSQMSKEKLKRAGVNVRSSLEALHDYIKDEQQDLNSIIRKEQDV